ncbi:uncharacterized protein LOC120418448 [Culex pipiens pallens]|uniref:uncharacterized protein LOC120418448 n=1 Tax=Culex pipiens pallens TaxID=42434 RepID=UPI0019530CCE|nr:uncharacterized protein LOC120418448 [Culex pipiens pallens]
MDTIQWGSLPEELQVMPFNLRIMAHVGLWGPRYRVYRFWALFTFGTMVILFPKTVLGIGSDDVTAICKGLAELNFEASIYIPMAIFALKRDAFERVIQGLDEIFREVTLGEESKDCYNMIREQNVKIKKFFKFLVVYCVYGPFAYCLPAVLISHWRFWNSFEPMVFELPMEQNFYGLQIRTNFTHYHIFVGLSMIAYSFCGFMSLIKIATMCFMIKYNSLCYRLVAEKIRKLPQHTDDGPTKVNIEDLKKLVEVHRKAYNVTELIEDICQVPLALEFLTCVIFWCLSMIYISKKIDFNLINVMIIFCLSLIETFGCSFLGSELAEEAEAVGKAIYDLPWYEHSVELQRFYRLIIQRTQRPTGITGVKLFVVQRTTFASVIQMSYSYYLVLQDLLNNF